MADKKLFAKHHKGTVRDDKKQLSMQLFFLRGGQSSVAAVSPTPQRREEAV